jgi:hypothetical protein
VMGQLTHRSVDAVPAAPVRRPLLIGLLALVAAGVGPQPLDAQSPQSTVRVELAAEPESVTVGQPFFTAVRVTPPPGYRVAFSDWVSNDTLQAAHAVTTSVSGDSLSTAIYNLVAWIAGTPLGATVEVGLIAPDGVATTHVVRLRLPEVLSVLPDAGEPIVPRPAKGLVEIAPAGLPWWWWLALLIGSLLASWLAYHLLKRREAEEIGQDPRTWALEQLDPGATLLLASGDTAGAVQRASYVLRTYIHRVREDLGRDLTSTELLRRLDSEEIAPVMIRSIQLLLRSADRVKFARHHATPTEAADVIRQAREWVMGFPSVAAEDERRAA